MEKERMEMENERKNGSENGTITLCTMTFSIIPLIRNDTEHYNALHNAECRNAECRILFIVMLNVIILNVAFYLL